MVIDLYNGDCLEVMDELIKGGVTVDAIITDPPYGTTACSWDSVIPFDAMWLRLNKLIKPNGAIVLFGSQPFSSALIMSNPKMYKCSWLWKKERPSNFFQAKFVPLNNLEDVIVFSRAGANNGSKTPIKYNPQGMVKSSKTRLSSTTGGKIGQEHGTTIKKGEPYSQDGEGYPFRIIEFAGDKNTKHPTQKPVALMEYLIKTYTNEDELVLDFTCGSGTTMVACKNLNRKGIGIEQDKGYFDIAVDRVENKGSLF